MVSVKQGFMDTVTIEAGTVGVYDTMALFLALINASVAGIEYVQWEMIVPAQQKIRWGYGTPAMPMNQGYAFYASVEEGVAFSQGLLALAVQNNPRTDTRIVKRMDDSSLHTGDPTTIATARTTDKNQLVALPEMGALVGQDSRLQLRYTQIFNGAGDDAAFFSLPITRYMV